MSDDQERSQDPTPRRRQQARQEGLVAHSPELTAALGFLAGTWLLSALGESLVRAMLAFVRQACAGQSLDDGDSLMQFVAAALGPLAALVGGVLLVVVVTHLLQTGGLVAPGRLAPDPTRLWPTGGGSGGGLGARLGQSTLQIARGVWLGGVAAAVLITRARSLANLGALEAGPLLAACGTLLTELMLAVGLAWTAFGLLDFALRHRRFEERLRLTSDEQREEQRIVDGDPSLRSRRLQLARQWQRDPGELLAAGGIVLTGQAGLSVLLSGGPPPTSPVRVRTIARGVSASTLRHAAERAGLPVIRSLHLAAWFARARAGETTLPAAEAAALAALWPARPGAEPVG